MKLTGYVFAFLVILIAIWTGGVWYDNYTNCSTTYIQKTCKDYAENNNSFNKFCESICVRKDFVIEDCKIGTTLHKNVYLATIEDKKIVLKVDTSWFENVDHAEKALLNDMRFFNLTDYFTKIVFKYLGYNCSNCQKLVKKLLDMADADRDGIVSPQEAIKFGSLLSTQETFMLAARNGSSYSTINFYGYCDGLYIVERIHMANSHFIDTMDAFTNFWIFPNFLEVLESHLKDLLSDRRFSHKSFLELHESVYILYKKLRRHKVPSLEQRVDFVIGMTELVYDLESFEYGKIFSCDLHLDNVGFSDLSNFSVVKLTDLDEVFAAAKVFQDVQEKRCNSDEDCVKGVYGVEILPHEECSSFCQDDGFCSKRMKKDNLAYLCDKLFTDIFFNNVTKALSEQKLPEKVTWLLVEILNECKKPFLYSNLQEHLLYIRNISDKFRKLKQLIKAIVAS